VSLFELMVVLAVAGILTLLFIYSARYLMVTTRVSRVKEEHRVLKRALENYEADYGQFPQSAPGLHALDGPIAYLVRIPADPFSQGEAEEYVYMRTEENRHRWVIISRGPDGDSDFLDSLRFRSANNALEIGGSDPNVDDEPEAFPLDVGDVTRLLPIVAYDPTNGLMSSGDIITTSR
jgi:type II secretory pathway pseudopilin PulG